MCIGSGECLHRCMLMSRTHNTHIQVHIHAHTTHMPHHNQFSTRLFSDFHQYLSQSWAETSELLGRISTSEFDPQSFLVCFVLLCMCACMYPCVLRMYVPVCVPNPHTPWQSIQKPLVVPLSSPHQRAFVCGACIGTAQVGVSLVSLFDLLFKRSRLHCFDTCLT